MGVRHDDDLAVGGRQGRRYGEGDGLSGEPECPVAELGKADERLVHALEEDLPAALVAEDVVEILAGRARDRDHGARALGQRERLIDARALGRGEQLAREPGERRDPVVSERGVHGGDLARHVRREPGHLAEVERARVDAIRGGHRVAADLNRVEARLAERLAEAAELLPGLRLLLGVRRRAAVRALEGVTEDPGQVGRVGGAEREPGVAGGDRAVARQDAHPEGQALVVARALGRAVLGRRPLGLAHLEAEIGVTEAREALGGVVQALLGDGLDRLDQVDAQTGHHARPLRTARRAPSRRGPRRHAPRRARSGSCRPPSRTGCPSPEARWCAPARRRPSTGARRA